MWVVLPYGGMKWLCLLPSIHVCSYNSFWALASLKERLHPSLSPPRLLYPRIPRISNTSLWKTSFHLVLGFPTDLVLWNFPLRTLLWDCFFFHSYDVTRPFDYRKSNFVFFTFFIMRIKPTSAYKDIWICCPLEVASLLHVSVLWHL